MTSKTFHVVRRHEVKIRFGEFAAVYVDGELQDDLEVTLAEDSPEEELEALAVEACDVGYPYDPDDCEYDVLCQGVE